MRQVVAVKSVIIQPPNNKHHLKGISYIVIYRKGDRLSKLYVRSPGPVYDIGKVELVKNQAPAYTLRPKLIDIFKNFGPGAGAYGLDKVIYPKRPAWPFGIKHTDFAGILKNKCDLMMTVPCENPCGY